MELLALFAHEVSHLRGFNEEEAQVIQKWFLKNPQIVSPSLVALKTVVRTLDAARDTIMGLGYISSVKAFGDPDDSRDWICVRMTDVFAKRNLAEFDGLKQ